MMHLRRVITASVAAAILLAAAACSTSQGNIPAGPPAWRSGYADGCNSGYVAAGHPYYQYTKDVTRAQSDQTYNMGWQDGFNACKGSYDSTIRMMSR